MIAMVGKYVDLKESYKSLSEAIHHGGIANDCRVVIAYIDSEAIERDGIEQVLKKECGTTAPDGILIPGGFGVRGTEGKIEAVRYARENKIPFFGICLGLQMATIEYARSKAGIPDATSREFSTKGTFVIDIMEEQKRLHNIGGTMRLGSYPCALSKGSLARTVYGAEAIDERHRHRYEVNNEFREQLAAAGLRFSGLSPDGFLVEIIEIPEHPWFLAVQYHPEFKSNPRAPHPLFAAFVGAALQQAGKKTSKGGETPS